MTSRFFIAPSLLSANFATLGEEVNAVVAAGADMIHFDVMDNHYVPNLTVGPMVCQSLRKFGITAPIDVHLMVTPVDALITAFAKAGASYISFHPDATPDVNRSLQLIRDLGCKAGLAYNPNTPLDTAALTPESILDKLDLLLLMSVNPGFGGQAFIPETLTKIKQARALLDKHQRDDMLLEVDGGINQDNIADIATAGANTFVAGSAIFEQDDYKTIISTMRAQLPK